LIQKPEKKTTWKIQTLVGGNTTFHLKEAGEKGVDWIYQAQERENWRPLANTAMNVRVPLLDSERKKQILENDSASWRCLVI